MASIRLQRVAEVIRETAARVIVQDLADPRIRFVTVTRAEVSPDLQNARVFVSVLGSDADRRTTMRALDRAARIVRHACGDALKVRRTPEIQFCFDESIERSAHISELIREARRTDPDGGEGTGPEAPAPGGEGGDA